MALFGLIATYGTCASKATGTATVKNHPALYVPVTVADPLVLRDDFVCRYRRVVQALRPVTFCANTFSDASLQTFCDNR